MDEKRTQEKEGMNSKQKWRLTLQRLQVQIPKKALSKMKNGKASLSDNLEVWKSLGRTGVNFLKETLNEATDEEKSPDI